jgi:hypothetical protein
LSRQVFALQRARNLEFRARDFARVKLALARRAERFRREARFTQRSLHEEYFERRGF